MCSLHSINLTATKLNVKNSENGGQGTVVYLERFYHKNVALDKGWVINYVYVDMNGNCH
jgi:hypothetical protein